MPSGHPAYFRSMDFHLWQCTLWPRVSGFESFPGRSDSVANKYLDVLLQRRGDVIVTSCENRRWRKVLSKQRGATAHNANVNLRAYAGSISAALFSLVSLARTCKEMFPSLLFSKWDSNQTPMIRETVAATCVLGDQRIETTHFDAKSFIGTRNEWEVKAMSWSM